jgi:hypothetical protein
MLFTAKDACEIVAPFVDGGRCVTNAVENAAVLARVNECIRRLLHKSDPAQTLRWVRFNTSNNSITLPYEGLCVVGEPIIDGSPRLAFGSNYEFLPGGPGELTPGSGYGRDLVSMGLSWPTFFDIPSDAPRYLVAFSTASADVGKVLRVCGRDAYAAEIFSGGTPGIDVTIGLWKGGEEGRINLQEALNTSAVKVQNITSVHKPVTTGYIAFYTWEPDTKRLYFLSKYHPDETVPGYHRYKISGNVTDTSIIVRMKVQYVPLKYAQDILLIQNLEAVKLMAHSIEFENAYKISEAEALEVRATRLLNEQKADSRETMPAVQITDTAVDGYTAHVM